MFAVVALYIEVVALVTF